MQRCSNHKNCGGKCEWWSHRHDLKADEPCPDGVVTGCRGKVIGVEDEKETWWLRRAFETLPELTEEQATAVRSLLLAVRRGESLPQLTTMEWLEKYRGFKVKDEIEKAVDESGRVMAGVNRAAIGQMFKVCPPCGQRRAESQPLSYTPPSLPPAIPRNRQPHYATTDGLPIVLYGGVGRHASTDALTRRYAEALFKLGVDVRLHAYPTPVEDTAEWNRVRRFFIEEPQRFAATFTWRCDLSVPKERTAFRAVYSNADDFSCFEPPVVEIMNGMDAVFTASRWSADVMRENGVRNPVVIPLGVDRGRFQPVPLPDFFLLSPRLKVVLDHRALHRHGGGVGIADGTFVFFWAGMAQPRKGLTKTIEAYCAAFETQLENVLLWVHARNDYWGRQGFDEAQRVTSELASQRCPPMLLTDGAVTDAELNLILNRADCYLQTSLLEGFGLCGLQAMSCGTPVIATLYSGQTEYCDETNCFPVSCRDGEAEYSQLPPRARGKLKWADYERQSLEGQMRRAYEDVGERGRVLARGSETARAWSWERGARVMVGAIEGMGHQVARLTQEWAQRVSVLAPVRNGAAAIDRFLNSLFSVEAGVTFDVVVCDDGSTDDTWEALQKWHRRVKILRNETPQGEPFTRNRLFAESEGGWCFLCDADVEIVQAGWLRNLKASQERTEAGMVAPMLVFPDGSIQSAGGELDANGCPCRHRYKGLPADTPEANEPCEVLYAPAAAWFAPRVVVEGVGGLDEQFSPTFFGDVDWCYRARASGYKVWYEPTVKIVHHEAQWGNPQERGVAFVANREIFLRMRESLYAD